MSNPLRSLTKIEGMQTLMLAEALMEDVHNRRRFATIRAGARDIRVGIIQFEGVTSGVILRRTVTEVIVCPLREVPLSLIQDDGADTHEEMLAVLQVFYPQLNLDSEVTAVRFK